MRSGVFRNRYDSWDHAPRNPGFLVAAAILGKAAAGSLAFAAVSTVVNLGLSVLVSFVLSKLASKKQRQQDVKRELAEPNSLPPYRFPYGLTRLAGSPAPIIVNPKDGTGLCGCLIFSSRPSKGEFSLILDDRECEFTGDPYDFNGDGATVTAPEELNGTFHFWIGLGDQTSPPAYFVTGESSENLMTEPENFSAWSGAGMTVTSNTTIAPNGELTADTIDDTDAVNIRGSIRDFPHVVGGSYVASVFVKKADIPRTTQFASIRLQYYGVLTRYYGIAFDLKTGEFLLYGTGTSGHVGGVEDYDEYWRVWVGGADNFNNTSARVFIYPAYGASSAFVGSGTVTGSIVVWGAQAEQGVSPTEYVTVAAQTPSDEFVATDRWTNRTVLWFYLERGDDEVTFERWPNWPPRIELVGKWSLIWDCNDPAQDPDDPSTWDWSNVRALCVLDALRMNPTRPYRLGNLHLDSFKVCAAIDGEAVPLAAGGTEIRHAANGVLVWRDLEIHEQIEPIVSAGGSATDLVRIGGRLGIVPPGLPDPVVELTDVLREAITWDPILPSRQLASRLTCEYVEPLNGYNLSPLPVFEVPGAVEEDGGVPSIEHLELPFVTSRTQAKRLQKENAFRLREQDSLAATFPPEAFIAVGGSGATISFPEFTRMNGLYRVESITPKAHEVGDAGDATGEAEGVALRCPMRLVRIATEAHEWDPNIDEPPPLDTSASNPVREELPVPVVVFIGAGSSEAIHNEEDYYSRIMVKVANPNNRRVSRLEARYRIEGTKAWTVTSAQLPEDDPLKPVAITMGPVIIGQTYELQLWFSGLVGAGDRTDVLEVEVQSPVPSTELPLLPTGGSVTAGTGQLTVRFTIGNDPRFLGVEFWQSTINDINTAALYDTLYGSPNAIYAITDTVATGTTKYYWARAVGPYKGKSAFTASVNGTAL